MKPSISIVIPTYNREKLILETIDSVLNQTYQNFEILIIDDGSTDNTADVIQNLNNSKIRYIYQNNTGPSAARNNGIKNANGEFIAFMDSDDLWFPQKLEKQINALKEDPKLAFVSCWSVFLKNDSKVFPKTVEFINNFDFVKAYLLYPFYVSMLPQTSCMLIKKECFEKVGYFDETMISKEDIDMWIKVALEYDFYCIPEYLDYHRDHPESLVTTTKLEEVDKCNLKFLQTIFNNPNLPEELLKLKNKAYSYNRYLLGRRALYKCQNSKSAKKYLSDSFKYYPLIIKNFAFLSTYLLNWVPMNVIFFLKKIIRGKQV